MFSGLVESLQKIEKISLGQESLSLFISRPREFTDLKIGDSIAVDGICLTLEEMTSSQMKFTLGAETLKVLSGAVDLDLSRIEKKLLQKPVNLERSLKWGDRIHGHLVSGHIEALGTVIRAQAAGDSWIIEIKCPQELGAFIVNKGSIALQGVSLTVNSFENSVLQVCLIPETLKKTNLGFFKVSDYVHIETDLSLKSLLKTLENQDLIKKISEQIQLNCKGLL